MEKGKNWQEKVCGVLDRHTEKISANPDYISFELLDANASNPNSVESVYAEAE